MKKKLFPLLQFSLADIQRRYEWTLIDQATYEAYIRVWNWSAVRWSGHISNQQDRYWERYGKDAFYAKINKTRAAFGMSLIDSRLPHEVTL